MNYLIPLALSALSTNGVHAYLLLAHKSNRKWSISEHAVLSNTSLLIYRLGHIAGGVFSLLFAKLYFIEVVHMNWLFYVTLFAVIFDYLQASLPAQGKTTKSHTVTAFTMWISFIALGVLSDVFLPVPITQKLVAGMFLTLLIIDLIYSLQNKERLYRHQMIMVALFYIAMFVLVT